MRLACPWSCVVQGEPVEGLTQEQGVCQYPGHCPFSRSEGNRRWYAALGRVIIWHRGYLRVSSAACDPCTGHQTFLSFVGQSSEC
jgi:hypothetical protein